MIVTIINLLQIFNHFEHDKIFLFIVLIRRSDSALNEHYEYFLFALSIDGFCVLSSLNNNSIVVNLFPS
jgi:hypothetical protein